MQRVVVVGTTGSGKTTFAGELARALGVPHVELDALHWEPNWVMAPTDVFRARVAEALSADAWVADGNYSKARDLIWTRADTLVWLDYPLPLVMTRLVRRTLGRILRGTVLYSGNRENLKTAFSRDGLLLWALNTHGRHRREYPGHLAQAPYAHLHVVHLRSPQAANAWLARVQSTAS